MNRMQHEILIHQPVADVFDYVSTPGRWPEWHPSSLRLEAGAEAPLPAGARFEEDIHAGGRKAHLSWIVLDAQRPTRWCAEARADNGLTLTLEYRLEPTGTGTRFVRTLEYTLPNTLMRLYNAVIGRRRIERESRQSLQQLRDRMGAQR